MPATTAILLPLLQEVVAVSVADVAVAGGRAFAAVAAALLCCLNSRNTLKSLSKKGQQPFAPQKEEKMLPLA